ncbi:MAG: hypothetical protein MUP45_03895 [Candidatus Marinimicrobia bacterium]|nr:hypothetical protein [Candidatus Neomarinimicrobiota bacterium]
MIYFATHFWVHEAVHFALVGLISGFFYWRYRDWRLVITIIFFGLFLDVDHLFDFFAYYGKAANISNFFLGGYIDASGKIFVPLHSWEFLFWLSLLALGLEKKLQIKGLMAVVVLTYGTHLLWDQLCYGQHLFAYFLAYRFLNNFSIESFHGF